MVSMPLAYITEAMEQKTPTGVQYMTQVTTSFIFSEPIDKCPSPRYNTDKPTSVVGFIH